MREKTSSFRGFVNSKYVEVGYLVRERWSSVDIHCRPFLEETGMWWDSKGSN